MDIEWLKTIIESFLEFTFGLVFGYFARQFRSLFPKYSLRHKPHKKITIIYKIRKIKKVKSNAEWDWYAHTLTLNKFLLANAA